VKTVINNFDIKILIFIFIQSRCTLSFPELGIPSFPFLIGLNILCLEFAKYIEWALTKVNQLPSATTNLEHVNVI
jgi:hypothetical protein